MVEYTHKFSCKNWTSDFYLNEKNPNVIYDEVGVVYHSTKSWLGFYELSNVVLIELIHACLENK